ncbi:MAG: GNAT family N-acetyltransferase [Coriobacteriales bacterium]|nr:GNAT family N-acetyltransferase [Coriobacteriales bacterium]
MSGRPRLETQPVYSADTNSAARLERMAAEQLRRYVETARRSYPEIGADMLEVAGGVAVWIGGGLPENEACALGFAGPVTHDEVAELEWFFASRGERASATVCPLADASLAAILSERGWATSGFENVLVRELVAGEPFAPPDPGIEIAEVASDLQRATWAQALSDGFCAPRDPTDAQLRLGKIAASRAESTLLIALVDGRPAGTAELDIDDGYAWLLADATLPQYRGRGVHSSLQRFRLQAAADAGCDLAVTEVVPGSSAHRNAERAGFRVAYTRVLMRAPELTRVRGVGL